MALAPEVKLAAENQAGSMASTRALARQAGTRVADQDKAKSQDKSKDKDNGWFATCHYRIVFITASSNFLPRNTVLKS